MSAPAPRRRSLWILSLLLFIGGVLVITLLRPSVLPEFERRVAALKAAGQPIVPSDLPSATPLSAEQASQQTALSEAIADLGRAIPIAAAPTPGAPIFRETAGRRQQIALLLQSEPAARSLRLSRTPTGGYGDQLDSMSQTALLQRIEEFFLAASLDSIQRSQADEAVGSFTNAIRLRTLPAAGPGTILWPLDANSYMRPLSRLLEPGALQPTHLLQLQQALQSFEAAPLVRDQLLSDRVQYIHDTRALPACTLSTFSTRPGWRQMLASVPGWLSLRIRLHLGLLDQAGRMALDEFDAQLAELERIGTPGLLRDADRRHARIRSSSKRVLDLYFGPQPLLRDAVLRPRTHLRLGILALASARYRLDHAGSYPGNPAALVPRYLDTLPIDPFSGGAPVFERLNPGLAIGFDRNRLTGGDSIPPTEPGGTSAQWSLRH